MSMEIYILSDSVVPTTQAWQVGVDALGFDVRFLNEQLLQAKETRLPAEIQGKAVLLELQKTTIDYVRDAFPDIGFPDGVAHVQILRWSMTLEGALAAYEAGAAYIGAVKGLLIDTEEGKLNTPSRAIEIARDMAAQMPMLEAVMKDALAKISARPRN